MLRVVIHPVFSHFCSLDVVLTFVVGVVAVEVVVALEK